MKHFTWIPDILNFLRTEITFHLTVVITAFYLSHTENIATLVKAMAFISYRRTGSQPLSSYIPGIQQTLH